MREITKFNLIQKSFWGALFATLLLLGATMPIQAASGVTLTATPTSNTVTVGQSASYTIKINRDNYTDKVTLSATGLPSGVTATFTPNTTTANSSTMKLQTAANTPIGIFNITVKGTANAVTIAPIIVKLTTKAQPAIAVQMNPTSQLIIAGQDTSVDIRINRTNFDGEVKLLAQNLPEGVNVRFEPETTSGNSSRMYLYSRGLPFLPKDYGIIVQAKSLLDGIAMGSQSFQLRVNCGILWADQFGIPANNSGGNDFANDVTVGPNGDIYVAGYTYARGVVNPLTGSEGPRVHEAWVAKYSSSGVQLNKSKVNFPAGGLLYDNFATDIVIDRNNNIYVAGYRSFSGNENEIFVAKFNSNFSQFAPASVYNPTGFHDGVRGIDLRINASDALVMTAVANANTSNNTFDIFQHTFDQSLTTPNGYTPLISNLLGDPRDLTVGNTGSIHVVSNIITGDVQIEKYSSSGVPEWTQSHGSLLDDAAERLIVTSSGDVLVAGTRGTLGNPDKDAWLIKINSAGQRQWETIDATSSVDEIKAIDVDVNDNIVYAGTTFGNMSGLNPDINTLPEWSDIWITKRAGNDGRMLFTRQFTVSHLDSVNDLKIDASGNYLLAGYTYKFKDISRIDPQHEDALLIKFRARTELFLLPFISGLSPASVPSGSPFTITGRYFSGIEAVLFDGQYVPFTINSDTSITAIAPVVAQSRTGNVTISKGCHVSNRPRQLTVTP